MSATALSLTAPAVRVASAPARRTSVFLPKEHGSWSLALEPLALGLLIAPSAAGGALALAAVAGFFARRPAKLALNPTAEPSRRRRAFGMLALFASIGAAGLALAVAQSGFHPLWPLGLALPFAALFAAFDVQGEGRSLTAELAGATAFATVPVACATLNGWPETAALALGVLALGRSLPTVLLVRGCLRARKTGDSTGTLAGPLAALATLLAFAQLQRTALVSSFAVAAAALLLARAVWLASPACRTWSARRVGIVEMSVGLAYVAGLVVNYRLT